MSSPGTEISSANLFPIKLEKQNKKPSKVILTQNKTQVIYQKNIYDEFQHFDLFYQALLSHFKYNFSFHSLESIDGTIKKYLNFGYLEHKNLIGDNNHNNNSLVEVHDSFLIIFVINRVFNDISKFKDLVIEYNINLANVIDIILDLFESDLFHLSSTFKSYTKEILTNSSFNFDANELEKTFQRLKESIVNFKKSIVFVKKIFGNLCSGNIIYNLNIILETLFDQMDLLNLYVDVFVEILHNRDLDILVINNFDGLIRE